MIVIEYEDLFSTPQRTIKIARMVQEFLGVEAQEPQLRMKKIVQGDPLKLLENGEEVRAAISDSRFAEFLSFS